MFSAKLTKAAVLKKVVDSVKELVGEAPIDCNNEGLTLQAMDAASVAMVSLKLGVGLFETYRCDHPVNLGVNMKTMAMALKCAENDDPCTIEFNASNDDSNLLLEFVNEVDRSKQLIRMHLMDIEEQGIVVPEQQNYQAVLEMSSAKFHKSISNLAAFGSVIKVRAADGQIEFETSGGAGSNTLTFTADPDNMNDSGDMNETTVSVIVTEPVNTNYSARYLTDFSKAIKVSDFVRIGFSNNQPISVEYTIERGSWLKFCLAPKIIADESMDH